ncbi:MAG: M48 family metalloprotease [Verrucomicrobiales bacterium]|nr:M48 family metalloprotease [Verrucomicrobiales bacterium]
MNTLLAGLTQPWAEQVGWTLLHFLWQGLLIALAGGLVRAALRRHSANARYLAGCLTLLALGLAPIATFIHLDPTAPTGSWLSLGGIPAEAAPTSPITSVAPASTFRASPAGGLAEAFAELAAASVPWLTGIWLAGVTLLSLRLSAGWVKLRRLPCLASPIHEPGIVKRFRELCVRLEVSRPVQLLNSGLVRVPMVLGWFRPAILLPTSTLTGLSPRQIDFILAHELAHLRRGDHWVNLCQVLLETVLFYHPAVWWVSRHVREDREHCCDDLALGVCGDGLAGAQALAALETLRQRGGRLALAANDGSLLTRVRRLLGLAAGPGNWRRSAGNALIGVGLLALIAGILGIATSRPIYTATCRVLLRSSAPGGAIEGGILGSGVYDPYRLATEVEQIRSAPVLSSVVKRYRLVERWGLVPSPDAPDPETEALLRLQARLELRALRNTSLIEIRVSVPDAEEAAELANAIATAYRERRLADHQEKASAGLGMLKASLDRHTEAVNRLQARVDDQRSRLGVSETPEPTSPAETTILRETASSVGHQLVYAEAEYVLHKTKLDGLRRLEGAELRRVILTVLPDEQLLPKQLEDLASVQQKLAGLVQGRGEGHPELVQTRALQAELERQVQERIAGIMLGLEHVTTAMAERRAHLAQMLDERRDQLVREVKGHQELLRLKRDLESEQRVRDALYLRVLQEEIDGKITQASEVGLEIIDPAATPLRPSRRPAPPWAITLGSFGLVSCLSGGVLRSRAGGGP